MSTIVVIGDPILDLWRELATVRPNPEDPGTPVTREIAQHARPGGAANVAVNLARLGHYVQMLPTWGWDGDERFRRLLLANGVEIARPAAYPGAAERAYVTTKSRLRLDGRLVLRNDVDVSPTATIGQSDTLAVLRRESPQAVAVSDYGKGSVGLPEIRAVLQYALETRSLVLLELKPKLITLLRTSPESIAALRCTKALLKCNLAEARLSLPDHPGPAVTAHDLCNSLSDAVNVVVTRGANGLDAAITGLGSVIVPAPVAGPAPLADVNVCGAGDVLGALLLDDWLKHRMLMLPLLRQAVRLTTLLCWHAPDPYTLRLPCHGPD